MSFSQDIYSYCSPIDEKGTMSIVCGDTYYRRSLEEKYGTDRVNQAIKQYNRMKDNIADYRYAAFRGRNFS